MDQLLAVPFAKEETEAQVVPLKGLNVSLEVSQLVPSPPLKLSDSFVGPIHAPLWAM